MTLLPPGVPTPTVADAATSVWSVPTSGAARANCTTASGVTTFIENALGKVTSPLISLPSVSVVVSDRRLARLEVLVEVASHPSECLGVRGGQPGCCGQCGQVRLGLRLGQALVGVAQIHCQRGHAEQRHRQQGEQDRVSAPLVASPVRESPGHPQSVQFEGIWVLKFSTRDTAVSRTRPSSRKGTNGKCRSTES